MQRCSGGLAIGGRLEASGYGEGREIAETIEVEYATVRKYGSVARAFTLFRRRNNFSFKHHAEAMAVEGDAERDWWLDQAVEHEWSANKLRAEIAHGKAFQKTKQVELDAEALGKFVVLYADPPWRYENPPMGGTNRSIENHHPTMTLEEICALLVGEVAHVNSVLFLWATSPQLAECMKVIEAWGFLYRTDMVWVKDKIGMGYHFREHHECLLVAKRGELPPPAVEARPSSVLMAPRLERPSR
jgi:MT-A70